MAEVGRSRAVGEFIMILRTVCILNLMLISWNFPFIFSDCGWLRVTETMQSEAVMRGTNMYILTKSFLVLFFSYLQISFDNTRNEVEEIPVSSFYFSFSLKSCCISLMSSSESAKEALNSEASGVDRQWPSILRCTRGLTLLAMNEKNPCVFESFY